MYSQFLYPLKCKLGVRYIFQTRGIIVVHILCLLHHIRHCKLLQRINIFSFLSLKMERPPCWKCCNPWSTVSLVNHRFVLFEVFLPLKLMLPFCILGPHPVGYGVHAMLLRFLHHQIHFGNLHLRHFKFVTAWFLYFRFFLESSCPMPFRVNFSVKATSFAEIVTKVTRIIS